MKVSWTLIFGVALRKESVDRNRGSIRDTCVYWSLSARRAWIEIRIYDMSAAWNRVALRKESVDRNTLGGSGVGNWPRVALRKESVDRNVDTQNFCICIIVALRKESVDRNADFMLNA